MTAPDAETRQLIDNASRFPFHLDLHRLCDECQLNPADVDWRFFPHEASFEILCIDNIRNLFRTYVGVFLHNDTKFCLQVFWPRTVLAPDDEVRQCLVSMMAEIMRRREFNHESMRRVSTVEMTTYYRGFACVSLRTSQFDDIRVFKKSFEKCVDDVCETITMMTEYNDELDAVFAD